MGGTYTHTVAQEGPEAGVVAALAQEAQVPQVLDPEQLYAVPRGEREVLDLEKYLDAPRRKTGTAKFATLESFTEYAKHHRADDSDRLTVWVPTRAGDVVAVLNDHGKDGAEFGDHRAVLSLVFTEEWKLWTDSSRDGRLGSQQEFAEHIEEGLPEIVEPDGATMLELAQSFHASVGGSFTSVQRLTDGSIDLRVTEDVDARAGFTGQIEVPQEFTIRLAPFVGEDPWDVLARLRYRVRDGELRIGYKLERPEKILEAAFERVRDQLAGVFDRVYTGQPR